MTFFFMSHKSIDSGKASIGKLGMTFFFIRLPMRGYLNGFIPGTLIR